MQQKMFIIYKQSDHVTDRHTFLGAFAKFRIATTTFATSVCLSVSLSLSVRLRHDGTEGE